MAFEKPCILYDNRLNDGFVSANYTGAGNGANLKDLRTYTYWEGSGVSVHYVTVNCGSPIAANGLGIIGHNFASIGAVISVECSSDNFAADITVALVGFVPASDKALFKKFTSQTKRYWRLKMSGMSAAPRMAVLMIGTLLEFPAYLHGGFDPAPEQINSRSKRSKTGNFLGSVVDYQLISISAKWDRLSDDWGRDSFRPAWDAHLSQLKPFFWAFAPGTYPNDVYFVKVLDNFTLKMPYDSVRRSLILQMEGVKE